MRAGTGHSVAFRLQGDALSDELQERSLPVPLKVYDYQFSYVIDGDDGDFVDALGQDGVSVFNVAGQVVEVAGRRKRAWHREQNHLFPAKGR